MRLTAIAVLAFLGTVSMDAEEKAVGSVVQAHIDGVVKADADALRKIWAPDARLQFVSGGKIKSEKMEDAIARWTKAPVKGTSGKIHSIDFAGKKLAVVKIQLRWKGKDLNEFLTLLKVGDTWKLVNKTFSAKSGGSPYGK